MQGRRLLLTGTAIFACLSLSACSSSQTIEDILKQDPTRSDQLPSSTQINESLRVNEKSARGLGTDSSGNSYFVARTDVSNETCFLAFSDDGTAASSCGTSLPLQVEIDTGSDSLTAKLVTSIPPTLPAESEAIGEHVVTTG